MRHQVSFQCGFRQSVALLAFFGLTACGSTDEAKRGMIGYVEGFLGGVVADEPQAALIGRDILSAGGSAADAAVATYFALSVTLPSAASLGGGGVCVVHDGREATRKKMRKTLDMKLDTTEVLEFLPSSPATLSARASRPSAIPGNPRGFYTLHAKYGRLPWAQLVGPAEQLARFGFQVPRTLAREIAAVAPALLEDPEARRIFGRKDGGSLAERDFLTQVDLAGTLGTLRSKGPGAFYNGPLAKQVADAATAAGGTLTIDDLRTYTPQWQETVKVPFGNLVAHFSPPPASAGTALGQIWSVLLKRDEFAGADEAGRHHEVAEIAMRVMADRGRWMGVAGDSSDTVSQLMSPARLQALGEGIRREAHTAAASLPTPPVERPENPAASGFVVVDSDGSAVACTVTLNNLFGTGRVARGTGIVLAAAPDTGGRGYSALTPMLAINHHVNQFHWGATATGGASAPAVLAGVAARTLLGKEDLERAVATPRSYHGGASDVLYHEPTLPAAVQQQLAARGHRLAPTPVLGLVNAISCSEGLPDVPKSCSARQDPRGFGLASSADEQRR
ncbi:MAG: gamma-glutamyltransferase family protein [Magnetospirillum sp. WYHS-4]